MVICLERGADLHTAQLMPLPLTGSCFSKIQIGFTFLVPAHLGIPGKRAIKRVCVCVCCSYDGLAIDIGELAQTAYHPFLQKSLDGLKNDEASGVSVSMLSSFSALTLLHYCRVMQQL